jgi:plastocyanin
MAEHEHKDEPILMTSPGRMMRGIIIVVVTLAIGTAVVVTQFENFFANAPPVSQLPTGGTEPPPPPTAGVTRISILSGSSVQGNPDYDPDEAEVPVGNKVVWANQDTVPHTATSGSGPSDPDSGAFFDTSFLNGGEESAEVEITGDVGDTFAYYCTVHPYMTSQLTLVEAEEGGAGAGSGQTLTIPSGASVQGNTAYDPDPMEVTAGDVINVVNRDNVPHTVTSGTGPSDPESASLFDTSIIDGGASGEIDTAGFSAGEYDYYCIVHPYMIGKLRVTE